jgi:hypothetical protein
VGGSDIVEYLNERPMKELVERFVEAGCQTFGVPDSTLALD